jgi:3',5'-nucleoside bisphosphate phosphatase
MGWYASRFVLLVLFLLAAATEAQVRAPLDIPDVAGYKVLKCDFHLHTVFSDGEVWPAVRVREAWTEGLDAIAITDHDSYFPHRDDVKVDLWRPYKIALPVAEDTGILLLPGVEITRGNLHFNALFVKDPTVFGDLELIPALRKARGQDAFVFWNHPGWKGKAEWWPPIDAAHGEGLMQAIEVVNGTTFYGESYPWLGEKKLGIVANSDSHAPIPVGQPNRKRPITLVFAKQAGVEAIREALFAQRSAAWLGEDVWGPEALVKGLWDVSVKAESNGITAAAGRRAGLQLRNSSAIPYRVKVLKQPDWMRVRAGEIAPQRITGVFVDISKDAPKGTHQVALELEVTNLHTAPKKNVTVVLPCTVAVR